MLQYYGVYHAELNPTLAATMGNVCVTARWLDPMPLVEAGLTPVFQVEQPNEALLRDPESSPRWPSIVRDVELWQDRDVRPAGIWLVDEFWHSLYGGWFHNSPDWPSLQGTDGVPDSLRIEFLDGLERYGQAIKRLWPGVPIGGVDTRWDEQRPVPKVWDYAAIDVYNTGPWPVPRDIAEKVLLSIYEKASAFGRPLVGVGQAFGGEGFAFPPPEMLTLQAEIIGSFPWTVGLIWYGLQFTQPGKVGIADSPELIAAAQAIYQGRG